MTRAFALAAMAALLAAGCTATSGSGPVAYYGASPAGPAGQLAHSVSTGQGLVRLPESAGSVLTVVERRSGEVVAQEITLKADASTLGENMVRIAIGRLNDGGPVLAPKVAPARASDIELEMAEAFPGVTMRIAETVSRNAVTPPERTDATLAFMRGSSFRKLARGVGRCQACSPCRARLRCASVSAAPACPRRI
jgi:hypothetical protein